MSDEAKVVWSDTRIQKYLGQYYDVTIVRDAVRSAMWMLRDDYETELATLRAERDQWQQRAEGAVHALMLTEPKMLAGNLTEWIANCAQMIEAQGRRLAELEAIKAAPQWREVTYKDIYTPLAKPSRTDYADLCERWSEFHREPLCTEDGHEYAICRRITQEGDDAAH